MSGYSHPSAIIDQGATVGAGCKIWHFTHICSGAKIGKFTTIGQNVFVSNKARIGDYCKIQNNVSIYDGVQLENDVFCGPSVVFTNVYNPRAAIEKKNEFQDTIIKQGVTLGANSTIVCGVTVSKFAFVGAGSVITRNVDAYSLVVGVPARHIGWVSEAGEGLDFESSEAGIAICPKTKVSYVIVDGQVEKVDL